MPVHSCQEGGKPGWKWGGKGKCYTYTSGDKEGSKRAHGKAERQGRAARAGGYEGSNKASGIQSLRFDKKKFNRSQAVSWAKSHGFKSGNVEEKPNEWRLRQFPPERCLRSGGMTDLSTGVRGYVCPTPSTVKSSLDGIKKEFDNIIECCNVE